MNGYPVILAAVIALPLLSGAAGGQTAEEAHKAEIAKQVRTCENMLVIGHPALEDIDVLGRCSAVASLQEDVLEGKALPDPLPDIDVQSALEKWRAKVATDQDHKAQSEKDMTDMVPEARKPETQPASGYRDPVSRPLCDRTMTHDGCQQRRK